MSTVGRFNVPSGPYGEIQALSQQDNLGALDSSVRMYFKYSRFPHKDEMMYRLRSGERLVGSSANRLRLCSYLFVGDNNFSLFIFLKLLSV